MTPEFKAYADAIIARGNYEKHPGCAVARCEGFSLCKGCGNFAYCDAYAKYADLNDRVEDARNALRVACNMPADIVHCFKDHDAIDCADCPNYSHCAE